MTRNRFDADLSTDTGERYTTVAIALHWAIAALILFNLSIGFFMEGFAPAIKGAIVPLHISAGLTVLALTAFRLAWRLTHSPPSFFDDMPRWQRVAAHTAHAVIYLMMIAMPLTGWAIISAHPPKPGAGPLFWGLVHVTPIGPISHLEPGAQKVAHGSFVDLHSMGAWIFLALIILHVGAALKHQFRDGHAELARMGIGWQ